MEEKKKSNQTWNKSEHWDRINKKLQNIFFAQLPGRRKNIYNYGKMKLNLKNKRKKKF